MNYALCIEKDADYFLLTLPDIPEVTAVAYDEADIQKEALDAFELALDFYTDSGRAIPLPQKNLTADLTETLQVPTTLAAKIYLYNEWLSSGKSKKELAESIHVKPSNLNRLFDFRYKSKMEAIEMALKGLGKSFEIKVA